MDLSSQAPTSLNLTNQPRNLKDAKKTKLVQEMFNREMTNLRTDRLKSNFLNSTHKDESTRLIGRFTSTIDTLNQILQKV
ncbi:MAG: hypothetical protein AAFR79_07135 [Pseudomonadota bacterium]